MTKPPFTLRADGRSPQGERGLKSGHFRYVNFDPLRRSPQGERGLKYLGNIRNQINEGSLSARRAWIEISDDHGRLAGPDGSLSARRAWIEMDPMMALSSCTPSLSARRAWIEISFFDDVDCGTESLSARRAWIEIAAPFVAISPPQASLSARRAWIEITRQAEWRRCTGRRSPQGERGLKFYSPPRKKRGEGRSPQGERGLKSYL